VPHGGHSSLIAVLENADGGPRVVVEVSAHHPASRRAVIVIGSKGSAQLADSNEDHILLARGSPGLDAERPEQVAVSNAMPLQRELAAFVAHLRGGPPPRSTAAEGLLVVERIASLRSLAGIDGP
jgi:predicted dehydrogenase